MQKHVNLCKSCRSRQDVSNEYLLAKFGVDTAENEPLKVHLIFDPRDFIFTEPHRPPQAAQLALCLRVDLFLHLDERFPRGLYLKRS